MAMIRKVADYFADGCGRCERFATADCASRRWAEGLAALRRLCLAAGLTETAKWGHPCYMHAGRNVALLGALREDFRLSFFDAALLADPEHILEKPGPNSQHADTVRFTTASQVQQRAAVLARYLREAMDHAAAGRRPAKRAPAFTIPAELRDALAADAELAAAFRALTPGRQRSYSIALGSAKTAATRLARIAKFRPKILAGKGALDR